MNTRYISAFIPMLFILGCQTATRPYDGVLGFKATTTSDSKNEFFYIDEDRRSWEEVEGRAVKACARFSGVKPRESRIEVISKTQFSQNVAMPVAVQIAPAGVSQGSTGASSPNPAGVVSQGSSIHHSFDRKMKLKKIVGTCIIAANPR